MKYFFIAFLWSLWCFFHSFLITPSITNYFKRKLKNRYKYVRLFYNFFALVSFISIRLYASLFKEEILFNPNVYTHILQIVLFGVAMLFFVMGTKNYDIKQFLGIRQLKQNNPSGGIGQSGSFKQTGILRYTRHPWYIATILILWAVGLNGLVMSKLIMNSILSVYVIIGTILEEKKLVSEFGDIYREYQKKVPMLIPYKIFRK